MSASVAEQLDEKAQYTKNKGMDDAYYMDLVVNYLKQFGRAFKEDIRYLLVLRNLICPRGTLQESRLYGMNWIRMVLTE